jgi:hypothetical protein
MYFEAEQVFQPNSGIKQICLKRPFLALGDHV